MGRTNLIILVFGIVATIALSLMMRKVATIQGDNVTHPVVKELMSRYLDVLDGKPSLQKRVVEGETLASVGVRFVDADRPRALAQIVGQQVWRLPRKILDFDRLELVVDFDGGAEDGRAPLTVAVRRPFARVRMGADGKPISRSRKRPKRPKKAKSAPARISTTPAGKPTGKPAGKPAGK